MKIIKIGSFDRNGSPTNWWFDLNDVDTTRYALGLDQLFPGSVDVNGVEIVEWTKARNDAIQTPNKN